LDACGSAMQAEKEVIRAICSNRVKSGPQIKIDKEHL
jgi:hypothetical protein